LPSALAEPIVPANLEGALDRLDGAREDRDRRKALLARSFELRSGRERPGRFWKIDLDALDFSGLQPAITRGPAISAPGTDRVIACDLATARREHASLVEQASAHAAHPSEQKFAALAEALRNCGAFVYVPPDIALDEPIEIAYDASPDGLFPYTLVLLDRGSSCTILERLNGPSRSFVCGRTEIVCNQGSRVSYACEQSLPPDAQRLWTHTAHPQADAAIIWNIAELGSALSVGTITVLMRSPGASAEINVLFFPNGGQHVDVVSNVEHQAGGSHSQTSIKSAATDRGQARYLGNIRIAQDAQATDARLRDDALLLSPRAHIDSVPALEIAANDVKAYHGATVGAIDEEQIFYMGSRGIARTEAERMIALGFFEPLIEHFPTNALRERLRAALREKVRQ